MRYSTHGVRAGALAPAGWGPLPQQAIAQQGRDKRRIQWFDARGDGDQHHVGHRRAIHRIVTSQVNLSLGKSLRPTVLDFCSQTIYWVPCFSLWPIHRPYELVIDLLNILIFL
jgi:hypothetical protein